MKKRPAPMDALKKYLARNGIQFRGTDERLMIFYGNNRDGIFIDREKVNSGLWNYLHRNWETLDWEFRGHYQSIYITPKV